MKNKASVFLKQIISSLLGSYIAKAKSMAVKCKMSAAKARLIMFTLMKTKKAVLLGSISEKIHGLLGDKETSQDDQSKAIVPFQYNATADYGDDEEDKYPDPTHCLFDEEELELEAEAQGGSIIEMMRNSKEEGEDFSLEDEIDHVADLFISRFYKQMRLQKLVFQEASRNAGEKRIETLETFNSFLCF
ncbi:hypothetical protein CRYUN_Cryun12cG0164000 [Craigia yunnanensis]